MLTILRRKLSKLGYATTEDEEDHQGDLIDLFNADEENYQGNLINLFDEETVVKEEQETKGKYQLL